jgi:hypothetical protein
MPNHVQHHFAMSNLTDKQKEILQKISSNHHGLCGYYVPMPNDFINTQSPANVVSEAEYKRIMEENKKIDRTQPFFYEPKPITKKMQDRLIKLYGYDNWYDWANDIWGTKWGCYDNHIDGQTYNCTTAWSPMRDEIVELFALDFPSFIWHWEEEQGYGRTVIFENGEFVDGDEYEAVECEKIGSYKEEENDEYGIVICHTYGRPETLSTEEVSKGFYKDYDFNGDGYLGQTLPMDIYLRLDDETQEEVLKYYHNN